MHTTPHQGRTHAPRQSLPSAVAAMLLTVGAIAIIMAFAFRTAPTASAATTPLAPHTDNNLSPALIVSSDITTHTVWTGTISLANNIKVENGAILRIEPGTNVTMCQSCTLQVTSGLLMAEGTDTSPIVFDAYTPAAKWNSVYLGGTGSTVYSSTLRYVEMYNGGGSDPTATRSPLYIDAYSGTQAGGPVIDHVTIENSGSYGIVIHDLEDADSVSISNTTIRNSARAPLYLPSVAMSGLGEGNTYENNGKNTIEVWEETIYDSQTIPNQGIPYELTQGFAVRQRDGMPTTVITIETGTDFLLHKDVSLGFKSQALYAVSTPDDPITFDAVDPAEKWGTLSFGGTAHVLAPTTMRYVELFNGGGNDPAVDSQVLSFDAYSGTLDDGPTIDHVTIGNSGSHGIYIEIEDIDPFLISNTTITGSLHSPLRISTAAMNSLGDGNNFHDNGRNTIEVWDDTTLYDSQTIPDQGVPYELVEGFAVRRRDGMPTTVITIEAGTDFLLHQDVSLGFKSEILHAVGTPDNPITFDAVDPAQPWETIYFGGLGHVASPSILRYVTLRNGGGQDDLTDPEGGRGMIDIYDLDGTPEPGPTMDYVTIQGSTSYGIFVDLDDADDTPPILSNLTITGTKRAPVGLYVAAAKGLGTGNTFTDNDDNVIKVFAGTVVGGRVYHDQTWHTQPIPYHVVKDFGPVDVSKGATLTIEEGNTVLMSENMGFRINGGTMIVNGTPMHPVTFTRESDNSPKWGNILLNNSIGESRFTHTSFLHAGGEGGAVNLKDGSMLLDHATVKFSTNAGVYSSGQFVRIKNSVIQLNTEGVRIEYDSAAMLRNNDISNNDKGLVVASSDTTCVDAMHNYWGSSDGPADTSSTKDLCGSTATNNGNGNSVSDGALYRPWLASYDDNQAQNASSIVADTFWVIANGQDSTDLTILVRDAQGNPLAGKEVELSTTRGTIVQPTEPTNEDGLTVASISSTEPGEAIVTAHNVTDDTPLAALAAIFFWQGRGDVGGLIDARGTPYASPHLIIETEPSQKDFPQTFRVPMQNTNAVPVSVTVTYGISGLSIGERFTPVDRVTQTLQPGEEWDATGGWVPNVTGHHCIQANIAFNVQDGENTVLLARSGSYNEQVNDDYNDPDDDDDDPCDDPDAKKLIPTSFGLKGVYKHFGNAANQGGKVNNCVDQEVDFRLAVRGVALAAETGQRDYEGIVTPPTYTPPTLNAGDGITQEQADAANAYAQANANLAALNKAIDITDQRIRAAVQAQDHAAANEQYKAYVGFKQQRAQALDELADSIDHLLAVTEEAGDDDAVFAPQDYLDYLDQLKTSGFPDDTLAYLRDSGMSDERIEGLRQTEIYMLENSTPGMFSVYDFLKQQRDYAHTRAEVLRDRYGTADAALAQNGDTTTPQNYYANEQRFTFTVGNPTAVTDTVNLRVRPVNLPADWTYSLDTYAPVVGPGESTQVELTVTPGGEQVIEGTEVRVSVEGFINEEYIGGVLFGVWVPGEDYVVKPEAATPTDASVYVPLVLK